MKYSKRPNIDDTIVLYAALRLIERGIYPSGQVVCSATGGKWTAGSCGLALRRLRDDGTLVVPAELEPQWTSRSIEAKDDREEIAERIAVIREAHWRNSGESLTKAELFKLLP